MREAAKLVRAVLANQLARLAPQSYLRLTGQTGRGSEEESALDIARYFSLCVDDYLDILRRAGLSDPAPFAGKTLLEYGPGDFPGVAALMLAQGARMVYCVDRFSMVRLDEKNAKVLGELQNGMAHDARLRLRAGLRNPDQPQGGFLPGHIEYRVSTNGTSGLEGVVDLIYSRAVLEHVNDLEASFADMVRALRPGGLAMHKVDLRSHGLHRRNPLDFLEWSPWVWDLMHSAKGVPNRWRLDTYRRVLAGLPVDVLLLESTSSATAEQVAEVRPGLPALFKQLDDADLSCLGFWLVFRKREG